MWVTSGHREQVEGRCRDSRVLCVTEQGTATWATHFAACSILPTVVARLPNSLFQLCSSLSEGKCTAQQSMVKQLHKQPEKQITESILLLKICFHQFKAISSGRWWWSSEGCYKWQQGNSWHRYGRDCRNKHFPCFRNHIVIDVCRPWN